MGRKSKLVTIVGPTAIGKTRISIILAKILNGEIISADSMQVYKHMDIGTAKPSQKSDRVLPHYLMDIIDRMKTLMFIYQQLAKQAINCIIKKISY